MTVATVTGPPAPTPPFPECGEVLARASGENFPVAPRLLPRAARDHLLAFYGFARLVDELGDAYAGDRLAALDWVEAQLDQALSRRGVSGAHPLVEAAARSAVDVGADPRLLRDLITANRLDQTCSAYASFDQLLAYCRLSANPVGRLVLAAFGASTPQRQNWSDSICTALQVVEHCQDLTEDARAGRVYLPEDDLVRFGVDRGELASSGPASGPLRALVSFEAARARRMLDEGLPLVASLRGRPRFAVAGFVAGGHAAIDGLAARRFDPLGGSTRPSAPSIARHMLALLARPGRRREAP